jgi:nucleotide-binding universal stress UspA family protein
MTRFETILVPVDFSDHSKEALDTAIQIAHLFGSTVHLLHCYHIQTAGISPYGIVLPSGYYADIRAAAEKHLNDWYEMVSNEGIQSESILSADSPSLAINLAAEEVEADLIVMGTRGLSGLKHAVLGSVAERVVRLAPCPVLTVKHPEAD